MTGMETILSIIATIISSIALIGVIVSLVLQNQQLKASRVQMMREIHLELTKMAMENPALASSVYGAVTLSDVQKTAFLNFSMIFLQTGYSLKMFSKETVKLQIADLLSSEDARTWWATLARDTYTAEARTKLERDFVSIADGIFHDMVKSVRPADDEVESPASEK